MNANTFQYDGRAYYYIADLQTWADAELNCVSQYNGHLVSFYSATQMAAVYSGLGSPGDFWIGFNDIATEGTWVWTDESPVNFTAWIPGQPSNSGGNEDCGQYYIGDQWNDNNCNARMASVCFACAFWSFPSFAVGLAHTSTSRLQACRLKSRSVCFLLHYVNRQGSCLGK